MKFIFRWLLRLFFGAVIVAGVALFGAYYLGTRSLIDYNETHRVAGVSAPVEIVRDNVSVPHIFGKNDADVFFALGFAHAQDRLWQMSMLRRTAQGRLSEIFGKRTFRVDELMRRLDIYTLAAQSVPHQDARTQAALAAYAKGVNAWIARVNEGAKGRGAPEFFLFSPEIAHWQPADSLAILKLMGVKLSGHLEAEVLRARLSLTLSPERLADILPETPGAGVAALPDYAALMPGAPRSFAALDNKRDPLSPFPARGLAGASNAWAAAPARSAAGGTLLANDPHLGFTAPSIWYLARLDLQSGGVIGATIPGTPGVLLGRSEHLGWGLTSAYLDDQDLFIEKLNPDNPEEYLTPSGDYKKFVTRSTIVRIKDEPPVTLTLRWSDNGPILPAHHYDVGTITPKGHVAALSWTLLSARDTTPSAFVALLEAGSVQEAIAGLEPYVAPAQNVTLIDRDTIAMQTVGALPRRSIQHQSQGRLPSPGWLAQNRWQGTMGYGANPRFLAPEGGIVGNTNNKVIDKPFPFHVSFEWGDTQRVQRWRKLMQNREVHTRDSFIETQLDTVSFTARSLLPLIARDLWYSEGALTPGSEAARRQQALDLLANWNGEMNEHLPEPLIYAAWLRHLQMRLIRDELGPMAEGFAHVEPVFIERVFRDIDGAGVWCDVVQSTQTETCQDAARIALDEALNWIDRTYGGDLAALRWGDAHEAHHDHPVLGKMPLLRWVVNIRQSTSGGDNTLLRGRTSGRDPDPFVNVHGAGYRGVYDFADPDSSVFIISTGQSGHPLSRHYDDLGALWRRGEYIPMSLDPDLARAAAAGITRLDPKPTTAP